MVAEKSRNQEVLLEELDAYGVSLFLKREDELHKHISGNKFRKLKYNLIEARENGFSDLLTFGGAYSNHIAALSYAGKVHGFGVVQHSAGIVQRRPLVLLQMP